MPAASRSFAVASVLALTASAHAQWSFRPMTQATPPVRPANQSSDGQSRVDSPRDGDGRPQPVHSVMGRVERLPLLPTGVYGSAVAISGDGTRVAGWSHSLTGIRAVRWTSLRIEDLGMVPGASVMLPVGMSDNGDAIAGFASFLSPVYQPFRWTASGGMQALETSSISAVATSISANGAVIGGEAFDTPWGPTRATFWERDNRERDLFQTLVNAGLDLDGWNLTTVNAISDDGWTLWGRGEFEGQELGFIATIPSPGAAVLMALAGAALSVRRRRA